MIDQELAQSLKAWPFKEALQIIKKNGGLQNFKIPSKGYVLPVSYTHLRAHETR